ncbi:Putative RNA-binding protein 15B [Tinamus guttatus]|uniref:Putative RNA-binding protein 15B n=1 Tax=Tinamus guttatus TaxID=94827 RepID=A0A099ZQL1_TINGU|nr:Putative RNA-binding protein 15B [Tinamus guttatus]
MPEDDQRATRNLFIGNLDHNVSEVELRRAFEKYGIIEEVVIKRPARGQGGAYAFLKFQNLDMAHRAKVAMSGRVVGRNPIKIGYGKANPTTRLWVGGLGPSTSLAALSREFDRFGSIRTIDYVKGDSFAYIQYESLDAAQAACAQMRGFPLGGPERRLRVDFAKAEETRYPQQYQPAPLPVHYELLADGYSPERARKENHTTECGAEKEQSNSLQNNRHAAEEKPHREAADAPQPKKRDSERNHRTGESESKSHEEPKSETKKLKNLSEYAQTLQLAWNGLLVLKNSCFPTSMHILEGDLGVINGLLKDHSSGGKLTQLKIAQRLRLSAAAVEPGLQRRLLRNLVSYLKQKQAAGVISLPVGGAKGRDSTGMLYAFPPCDFSQQYLQSALRTLGKLEEEHMVIVIVKDTA